MSLNLYLYHSDSENLIGFDQVMNSVPSVAWGYFFSTSDEEDYEDAIESGEVDLEELQKREDLWSSRPEYSYMYAYYILKGKRFIKGEDAIATDARFSYYYAMDVLQGERVEKIEDAIATDAWSSFGYAYDVLDGERFIKGEDVIRGSAWQDNYEQLFGIKL